MMPRVFCQETVTVGQLLTLDGPNGHHFARVLRVRVGEELAVAGLNGPHLGVVDQLAAPAAQVVVRIQAQLPSHEPEQTVYLIQGMPKGDKVDTILQKCTEIGLAGLVLMRAKRSIAQLDPKKAGEKLARWQRIALEAASQSQRDKVPSVSYADSPLEVKQWLQTRGDVRVLMLDEAEHSTGIRSALTGRVVNGESRAIAIVVGPEGGWDDAERIWWQNEMGAETVSVGPRILRTETAGVVALTAVLYETGELGG